MTPDQLARESRRLAAAEPVIEALRDANRPMRTIELADKLGISMRIVGASLQELAKMDKAERIIPISYRQPALWVAKPCRDVPQEYIQASSIWQVGYRVARLVGAQA